tara:strand:+ start:15985 stop:17076 length:1092 start_codon:yes stop_codon:yes gene_type:complete
MAYKKKYNNGGLLGNIDMSQYQSAPQFTPTNFGNTQGAYNPLTGMDTTGATGGFDQFGRPIAAQANMGAGAGLIGIGAGIADLIGSNKEIKRQRGLRQQAQMRADAARKKLDAFEFDVSQAERDLATAGIRPTDTSYIQSGLATALGSMNDPRAAANISGLLGQTLEAERQAKQSDLQRELGAMGRLAGLEQSALQQKQGLQLGLQQQDLAMGLQDRAMAQQNIEAARAAKRDAFGNIISGVGQTALAFAGVPPIGEKGMRVKYEDGGVVEELLRRQPVQKTEGEFNHDTNKKAIIDEETGVKEGEATGGEYILNPEQGEEIHMAYKGVEQIVESGEEPTMDQLMALYEAVQSVFSQPQFNEA